MTRHASLDAIIEECERLEAAFTTAINDGFDSTARECDSALIGFYADHGYKLLAVAKAAVEMREAQGAYFGVHSVEHDPGYTASALADATALFDAAVRGDAEKGER